MREGCTALMNGPRSTFTTVLPRFSKSAASLLSWSAISFVARVEASHRTSEKTFRSASESLPQVLP